MSTLNHKEISTPKNCNLYLWFAFENVRRLSYYASLLSELWWWVQVWSFLFWSEIENEHLNISNRHWSDQFYKVVSRFHACSSFLIFFDRLIPILAVAIYHLYFIKHIYWITKGMLYLLVNKMHEKELEEQKIWQHWTS